MKNSFKPIKRELRSTIHRHFATVLQHPMPKRGRSDDGASTSASTRGGGRPSPPELHLSDADILRLFAALDLDDNGRVTRVEVREAFARQSLPFSDEAFERAVGRARHAKEGALDLRAFTQLVRQGDAVRRELFRALDRDEDGIVSREELRQAFRETIPDEKQRAAFVNHMMSVLDKDKSGSINYAEFTQWSVLARADSMEEVAEAFRADMDMGEEEKTPPGERRGMAWRQQVGIFCAGAAAGVLSRSATAPLERMKIMMQTGRVKGSVWRGLQHIVSTQGATSLWRGNFANCLKVAPAKALKFTLYENVKDAGTAGVSSV